MKRIAALIAAALLGGLLPMVTLEAAAGGETTIKVALTDLSASAGMGPMGQYMMGPGSEGAQVMTGNGTMRPGYGWGPGTMGQWTTGMMAIRIDHDTVKAGKVIFDVTNWSRKLPHELLVVVVYDPTAALPYDYNQAQVKEEQVKVLGDTSELQPNASHTLELTLAPGSYLLICNVPGHYAAGMATPLLVRP